MHMSDVLKIRSCNGKIIKDGNDHIYGSVLPDQGTCLCCNCLPLSASDIEITFVYTDYICIPRKTKFYIKKWNSTENMFVPLLDLTFTSDEIDTRGWTESEYGTICSYSYSFNGGEGCDSFYCQQPQCNGYAEIPFQQGAQTFNSSPYLGYCVNGSPAKWDTSSSSFIEDDPWSTNGLTRYNANFSPITNPGCDPEIRGWDCCVDLMMQSYNMPCNYLGIIEGGNLVYAEQLYGTCSQILDNEGQVIRCESNSVSSQSIGTLLVPATSTCIGPDGLPVTCDGYGHGTPATLTISSTLASELSSYVSDDGFVDLFIFFPTAKYSDPESNDPVPFYEGYNMYGEMIYSPDVPDPRHYSFRWSMHSASNPDLKTNVYECLNMYSASAINLQDDAGFLYRVAEKLPINKLWYNTSSETLSVITPCSAI